MLSTIDLHGCSQSEAKVKLDHFLKDRVDVVLARLEMPPMFSNKKGVISDWFYQQLSTVKVPDFFAATQLQYTRNWAKHKLAFIRESHAQQSN